MNILLIHQNFPGQYKHLGPALVAQGHTVMALTLRVKEYGKWQGISVFPYAVTRGSTKGVHPWLADFETKLLRAEACHDAAVQLRDRKGFYPDVILGHPGWGEPLFLRDVWPQARLGLYCELFYRTGEPYTDFDPEFPPVAPGKDALRLRMKNINNGLHFDIADKGISPTLFQADTFPDPFRKDISVIHDGVNTKLLVPKAWAVFQVPEGPTLTRNDEVITFVNRNLEPYRGYHVFMRALPALLRERPNAQVVIVGGDGVSYGSKPPAGQTWKQIYIDEVRGQISDADWARVHFVGTLPYAKFVGLLQVSRLHIYLTYPFVLSWSLLETMSVEGTILASDTAPVRELIEDGVTGALVDFFDGAALVARASALLDDPETSARLGQAARAHVQQHYDLETVCLPRQLAWVSDLAALPPRPLPV
jgi:glycosyltransferase involved in cell wall biosynthesis